VLAGESRCPPARVAEPSSTPTTSPSGGRGPTEERARRRTLRADRATPASPRRRGRRDPAATGRPRSASSQRIQLGHWNLTRALLTTGAFGLLTWALVLFGRSTGKRRATVRTRNGRYGLVSSTDRPGQRRVREHRLSPSRRASIRTARGTPSCAGLPARLAVTPCGV